MRKLRSPGYLLRLPQLEAFPSHALLLLAVTLLFLASGVQVLAGKLLDLGAATQDILSRPKAESFELGDEFAQAAMLAGDLVSPGKAAATPWPSWR